MQRSRDIEELYLTTLGNLGYQDAIFAWPKSVVARFDELVRDSTRRDPQWTAGFLGWLRTATPMRYPALVGAAAFAHERLVHDQHGMSRQLIDSVLQRADDPGHLLAHWTDTYGPRLPKPVKRGVADAVARLYDESALRWYDTDAHHVTMPRFVGEEVTFRGGIRTPRPFRFGDVIALVHPVPRGQHQDELFRHALDRRYRREPEPDRTTRAISSMSLPELLANLRRFDEAGIPFETAMAVAARLTDPAEVSASGILPLRFAAVHRAVLSRRWLPSLESAAGHSMAGIPEIPGRTLIVIAPDTDDGAVFGLALAQRCADADVIARSGKPFELIPGESPLHGLIRWRSTDLGADHPHGCEEAFAGHDRVVLIAEYADDIDEMDLPSEVPVYAWQTAHHHCDYCAEGEHQVQPPRLQSYGLTDVAFTAIPLIEATQDRWPWLNG